MMSEFLFIYHSYCTFLYPLQFMYTICITPCFIRIIIVSDYVLNKNIMTSELRRVTNI